MANRDDDEDPMEIVGDDDDDDDDDDAVPVQNEESIPLTPHPNSFFFVNDLQRRQRTEREARRRGQGIPLFPPDFPNFAQSFAMVRRRFEVNLKAYSVAMMPHGNERHTADNGGKIFLPPSCLEHLTQLNIVYPMLFKIENRATARSSHCGVLEFVAEEGRCYLPHWMMQNLLLNEGDILLIENVTLPMASFSKFEPQSVDFLDISNPKAILENALRYFACLTTGDTIAIAYNDKMYYLKVLETKPGNAVSIIECDMNVDFAPPVGYVEPTGNSSKRNASADDALTSTNYAPIPVYTPGHFSGTGNRLDGKETAPPTASAQTGVFNYVRGVPDYDYEVGTLNFARDLSYFLTKQQEEGTSSGNFQAFTGKGTMLRNPKIKAED